MQHNLLTRNRRVSQAFGFQKATERPLAPKLWRASTFSFGQSDSPLYWWHPCALSLSTQRSMKIEIRGADCELSEMAESTLDYLYASPNGSKGSPVVNIARAIELYDTLVQWKFSLPARLRLEDAILPSAILLQ
jgi:hypothetical protein